MKPPRTKRTIENCVVNLTGHPLGKLQKKLLRHKYAQHRLLIEIASCREGVSMKDCIAFRQERLAKFLVRHGLLRRVKIPFRCTTYLHLTPDGWDKYDQIVADPFNTPLIPCKL